MKFFTILFVALALSATGQNKYEFEDYERISNKISALQKTANNFWLLDDSDTQISFPEESFTLFTYNLRAQQVVYRKIGEVETASVTENVDLSRATGLTVETLSDSLKAIRIHFPPGVLKTDLYNGLTNIQQTQPEFLDFYVKSFYDKQAKAFSFDGMFNALVSAIAAIQVERGVVTEPEIEAQGKDFAKLSALDFLSRHPKSLYARQAQRIADDRATVSAYTETLCENYGWYPGMSLITFQSLVRGAWNYSCNSCHNKYDWSLYENKNAYKKNKDDGLYQFRVSNDKIQYFSFVHHYKTGALGDLFAVRLGEIKAAVPTDYISVTKLGNSPVITVTSADASYVIRRVFHQYADYFNEEIQFEVKSKS